ncbi:MAG TPA: hypothetical protein DIU15_17565 [Deltaproteobacteria bacterium]|nr:hypothetical protein [Deltaproteobacteria bacterium]HCP47852.1 hypothetical protein [Deltaproteobacteria bacterium]
MRLPAVLGEYRLVEQLGIGAFGNVYRAEVMGDLGFSKEVAIKLLDPLRVSDVPAVVSAFADEAGFLSKIHHPNIIKVIQFKEISHEFLGDTFLMVCELVRGQTLRELISKLRGAGTRMPLEALVLLLSEAVDALRYAHSLKTPSGEQLGLVHRDLKPENLMMSENGYLKILDFGIAWAGERLSGQTMTQMTKGTPLYMSPEQLRGLHLDGRSDLYSLGLIAFELVCMEPFVVEPSTGSVDLPALVHAAATTTWEERYPILRESLRSTQGYGLDEVPAQAIENLVGWLVSPLPDNRPPNALTLLGPVEALQDTWKPSRGRRFFRECVGEWSTADEEAPIDFPIRTPSAPPMEVAPSLELHALDDEDSQPPVEPVVVSDDGGEQHRAALESQATVAPMASSSDAITAPPGPTLPEVSQEEAEHLFDGFDSHASLAPIGVTEVPLPESVAMPLGPTRHMPAHSGMDPPSPLGALAQLDATSPDSVRHGADDEDPAAAASPGVLAEFDRMTGPLKAVAVNLEEKRQAGSKRALALVAGGGALALIFLVIGVGILVTFFTRWVGDTFFQGDPLPIELSMEQTAGTEVAVGAAGGEGDSGDGTAADQSRGASAESRTAAAVGAATPSPARSVRSSKAKPRASKRSARSRRSASSRKQPKKAAASATSPSGRPSEADESASEESLAMGPSAGDLWGGKTTKAKPVRLRAPTNTRSSSAWAKPPSMTPPVVSSLQVPPVVAPGGSYQFQLSMADGEATCDPKLWISPNGKKFTRKGMRHMRGGLYERTLLLPVGTQWSRGLYYYVGCCWGDSGPCSAIMYTEGAPAFIGGSGRP